MAISVMNPKIAVFFLALLVPFLPMEATTADRAGVAGLAMVIDGGWYVFAAVLLATTGAAEWLANKGAWVDRILGSILFAVAGWLLLS